MCLKLLPILATFYEFKKHILKKVGRASCSDGTSQQISSLSRAEPRNFGLELFKHETSKNPAFQA
jgi:hypothetical protein